MKTLNEIYEGLKADIEAECGIRVNAGGDMELRLRAFAAQLVSLWGQAEFVNRQCFPQSATGEYLERHAELRAISRKPAEPARGKLRFSVRYASSADITIPAGTRCMADDAREYETMSDARLSAGSVYCDADAAAVEAGSAGNAVAGEIAHMELAPNGIAACINTAAFSGGKDAESDDELRARLLLSYKNLSSGGNADFYRAIALGQDGVTAAQVFSRRRGRGTVDIVIADKNGMPDQTTVTDLQEKTDRLREICTDALVLAPTPVALNFEVGVTVAAGFEKAAVLADARSAVDSYFTGERLGKTVYYSDVRDLVLAAPGVSACTVYSLADAVSIAADGLPVCGTVAVYED